MTESMQRAVVDELYRTAQKRYVSPYEIALVHLASGDTDAARTPVARGGRSVRLARLRGTRSTSDSCIEAVRSRSSHKQHCRTLTTSFEQNSAEWFCRATCEPCRECQRLLISRDLHLGHPHAKIFKFLPHVIHPLLDLEAMSIRHAGQTFSRSGELAFSLT